MTKKLKATDIANRLISCAVTGGVFQNMNQSYRSFGLVNGISIPNDHAVDYMEAIEALFASDRDVEQTYTFASFEKAVAALISPHVVGKTVLEAAEVSTFFAELKAVPISAYKVFRPIFGIEIGQAQTPVALGPYTIYDTKTHAAQLESDMAGRKEMLLAHEDFPHMIRVTSHARESNKAIAMADTLFERFESIIRYLVGHRTKKFDVGIINFRGPTRKSAFVVSEAGAASASHGRDGMSELIPIDDPHFVSPDMGFDRIWNCMASTSITEMEKRLLLALEWIGQSLSENAPASAFLKSAIALEVLCVFWRT